MRQLLLVFAMLLILPGSALALQCAGGIVERGEQIEVVIAKCGEPTGRRVSRQETAGGYSGTSTYQGRGRFAQEGTFGAVTVLVETLTHNCGAGTLLHVLTFREGKLEKVDIAGHGFGPKRCDW